MGRFPWTEFLFFEVLHVIIFYPTPQHAYRAAVLAAMVYTAGKIYSTPEFTDPLTTTYVMGCTIAAQFTFTAYLLFSEGTFPNHWRRVRDEVDAKAESGGSDRLPSNFPFAKKLWWMIDLTHSVRMVGWVQEPKNCLPPHPSPSRRAFIRDTLKLLTNIVIFDFASSVSALTPAFDHRLHDPTDGPETYLAAVPLLYRVPYVLSHGVSAGTVLSGMHNVLALVCVGIFQSSPTLWPDLWGRWGDAFTVRKLWGKTWHQQLRPMLAGLGRLVANKFFEFPRGSNRSSYLQLYIAFFLSGLIHFSGDFMIEKRVVYRSFTFFLLQAVIITFEDFIIYVAKRLLRLGGVELKPGQADESWAEAVLRAIGYCWVTLWFCWTLPAWLDGASALGLYSSDRGAITQFLLDRWKQWA